ncbi:LuxR family transcriptional regulator [Actibacterium sp. XHP0104]|uniref:LuxR family transcriptional regulator n=1 Tax=Actibacterium sp. XHP0104 TaxID=2984335 RepID=UPI0021E889F3|nr:LuxR family transcriptional regulator [Actibacterium sp. XHP0104]MCV2881091.1 LuxR family transcriptional regulator [Actibacterium sp. XHP0104]
MLARLEELFEAETIEEVWQSLVCYMSGHGFDRLIYGFTRFRTAQSWGDLQDSLVLSNMPPDYLSVFLETGLYQHAPMMRWLASNTGSCSWSWVVERAKRGELTADEIKVLEFNQRYGLVSGYTVSFKSASARAKGALGIGTSNGMTQSEVDAYWQQHGHEICVFTNVAHLKLISLPYHGSRRPLTQRQREVLEWVGDGKTAQDIATIMGLTPATVEKHLRLAREALNVETTAQAVLKASYQNQIFLLESRPG